MKIINVLNNSALVAQNEKGDEFVLIGKGISFQKHPNDKVDMSKVEKQFNRDTQTTNELFELFKEIPDEYFDITCAIVRYANKKLKNLNSSIYISLFDHINSAIERYQNHIHLDFAMMSEIRLLYPKEYEVSKWALEYLEATLDIELPKDECGFISIHFINASSNEDNLAKTKRIVRITKDISSIVKNYYPDKIDEESMNYSRFLTHLKYFGIRYLSNKQLESEDIVSMSFPKDVVSKVLPCLEKIDEYLESKYGNSMQGDEKNYLILHICRLVCLK